MIPRISIPDPRDEALIAAALVDYAHKSCDMIIMGRTNKIEQLSRAAALLQAVYDGAEAHHAEAKFGPVPSDDDLSEALENMRLEFGDDTDL